MKYLRIALVLAMLFLALYCYAGYRSKPSAVQGCDYSACPGRDLACLCEAGECITSCGERR